MARSWSKLAVAVVASATVALGLVGCTQSEAEDVPTGPLVTVGSFESTESQILAELYAQALEHEGARVTRTFSVGDREAVVAALEAGTIDVVPDLNGELLSFFSPESATRDKASLNRELRKLLPEGLQMLDVSPAQSKVVYVVTRATADTVVAATADAPAGTSPIVSLADLSRLGPIALGATPNFAELAYGIPGLKGSYGLSGVTLAAIDDAGGTDTVAALLDGTVQLAAMPATSPAIAENDLVELTDPKSLIKAQNVVPILRSEIYTIRIANALNQVSNRLRSGDISALRLQVEGAEKAEIAHAAKAWLKAEGITG